MQLGQLQTIHSDILAMGYQVIAISPDSPEKARAFSKKKSVEYTLLSDPGLKAARALGIAYKMEKETAAQYEKAVGRKFESLPVPSVFIVGTDGVIKFEYVNPNYKVRIPPEVLLAAARASKE